MPYKILVIKDKLFEQIFQLKLKKVSEGSKYVIFECTDDIWISPEVMGINQKQFLEFYKRLRIYGGRKKLEHGQIHLYPKRKRVLSVRLHDAEYEHLKQIAPIGERPSCFIRSLLLDVLRDYVYEKTRRVSKQLTSNETSDS